jgi:DNA-binding response OmpR family regulator
MRVLVVEDNVELAGLVAKGLYAAGFESDHVATAADAEAILTSTHYAAVILDLGLPDGDGLAILHQLRGRKDSIPVLIVTARSTVGDRVGGLREGADDYLVKPFALDELVARLEALLRRPGRMLGRCLKLANVEFDTESRQVLIDDKPHWFSVRETTILELLMRRKGNVVPKKLVEDQIFGAAGDVSSNAVEVYVHRLRSQLTEHGAKVKIHTVRGVGYVIVEDA